MHNMCKKHGVPLDGQVEAEVVVGDGAQAQPQPQQWLLHAENAVRQALIQQLYLRENKYYLHAKYKLSFSSARLSFQQLKNRFKTRRLFR